MGEMITIPKEELQRLKERVNKLSVEKSYLQLIIHMMQNLTTVPGLDNTVEKMLSMVHENVGGTNLLIYYVIDNAIYSADVFGRKTKLDVMDDILVSRVFETHEFSEYKHDFSDTRMTTPEFTGATTWACPLLVGPDLIGVFKMENMLDAWTPDLRARLTTFFDYAALVLKNEILGHSKLKKAYDQLSETNAELIREVEQRTRVQEALRAEKARAEEYLNIVEVILVAIDTQGKISLINRKGCQILGYEKDQLLGKNWFKVALSPEDYEREYSAYLQMIEGEIDGLEYSEYSVLTKTGERRDIAWHNTLVQDEAGHVISVLSSGEDITDRKQAEEALRDSKEQLEIKVFERTAELWKTNAQLQWELTQRQRAEEAIVRLAAIVESSDDAIIGKTLDGIVVSWNSGAKRLYGYAAEEVIGRDISILLPPERQDDLPSILMAISRGEVVSHSETTRRTKEGRIVDVSLTVSPIKNAAGEVVGASSIARDITERKRAEEAVRTSEERFRTLFENSPVPIGEEDYSGVKSLLDGLREKGVTDLEGYLNEHPEVVRQCAELVRILDVNRAALEMYEASDKKELLRGLTRTFTSGAYATFQRALIGFWEGKTEMGSEAAVQTLNGKQRQVTVSLSVCPGCEETLSQVLVSTIDITERKRAEEKLQDSEERLRLTLEATQIGIWDWDVKNDRWYASPVYYTMLGYEPKTGPADRSEWLDRLHPDDRAHVSEKIQDVLTRDFNEYQYEARLRHADGTYRWQHVRGFGIKRDTGGKVTRMLGIRMDITERKQAEEELRTKTEELDRFFTIALDLLCIANIDGYFLRLNPAWEHTLGYSSAELSEHSFMDFVHPDDVASTVEAVAALAAEKEVINFVNRYRCKDGSYRWIEWRSIPVGRLIYAAARDITERKQAERELQQSNDLLRAIIEAAPTAIIGLDLDGKVQTVWNPAAEKMLGWKSEEVMGRFLPSVTVEGHEEFARFRERIRSGKGLHAVEVRRQRRDGTPIDYSIYASPLYDAEGRIAGNIAVLVDITERKRAEEELRQYRTRLEDLVRDRTDELQQRTRELETANERLLEADRLKSVFLASMSHEFRTPLNSIIGFTGIMLMGMAGRLNEEQERQLSMVRNSANHLLGLVNDLLDIAKIEAGKVTPSVERFELEELVNSVLETLLPMAAEKGLELIKDVPSGLTLISDKRRVKQILVNITGNAVKFTDHGSVSILVRMLGNDKVELRFTDTGIGISQEDMKRLFSPFQQIDTSLTKVHEGTGLGLYLSKKLAALLGGDIRVTSTYGKGSEFSVLLPLQWGGTYEEDPRS